MSDNNGTMGLVIFIIVIVVSIGVASFVIEACKNSFNRGLEKGIEETQNKAIEAGVGTFVQVAPGSKKTMFVFTNSIVK